MNVMLLNIKFDDIALKEPAEIICSKLGVELSDKGIPVEVNKADKLNVNSNGEKGEIYYITKASFFRMLTLFVKNLKDKKHLIIAKKFSLKLVVCGWIYQETELCAPMH